MRLASPLAWLPRCLLLLTCLAGVPLSGWALGIRVVDQGAEATSRGDAFAATADNPSAIYYNPAGISQLRGTQVLLGAYGVTYNNRIDLDVPGAPFDNEYEPQGVPQFYVTWELPRTAITLGLGVYAPFGFGTTYADDVPFRTLAKEGRIQYLSINPVVSIQVTRQLSFAVGPTFNYGKAEIVQGVLAPGDEFRFEGEDWAVGATAGLLWQPHRMHSFGVTYFSPTTMDFEGDSHLQYAGFNVPVEVAPGVFFPFPVPGVDTREQASAKFHFPQHVVVGYSFRPTPDWNFEANVDWTDWDSLNSVILEQKTSANVVLPFNWKSSFLYEFGVTRRLGDWKLSAGYVYSESSVPAASLTPLVPDTDRHILSVGVGRKWDRWNAYAAYQYTWSDELTISEGTLADGTYQFEAHAVTLSLGYQF
jgi:long-chain fatty acid transport protein